MPSPSRPALLVVAVVALVAAGCGGSSSDKKANEAYADSVCTAVGNWKDQIQKIATDFSGGISKASLQNKVNEAQAATKTLASEIKAISPPNTQQGQAAQQQLTQLTNDIENTVDSAKSSVSKIQDNASAATVTGELAALAPQVQSLANEAKTAIGTLKDAGGDLASAFKSTDSCKSLT